MNTKMKARYYLQLGMILALGLVCMLPIVFIISNSFMSAGEAAARYSSVVTAENSFGVVVGPLHYMDMTFLPQLISLSGWRQVLIYRPAYLRFMWNSIVLVIPIVVGQLVIAPLAAYGFERARAKYKDKLFFAYMILMLLPMQALLVPHFIAANFLGINNSYYAIILPAIFAPFGVFLIRQQMKGFDPGLIEAAKIDGASEFGIFIKVVVPNIRPALSALAVLAFVEAWNIVDQAVVFIRDGFAQPMAVHLSASRGVAGDMGIIFTLSTLFMIPALIMFIYGQEDLGQGIGMASAGGKQ